MPRLFFYPGNFLSSPLHFILFRSLFFLLYLFLFLPDLLDDKNTLNAQVGFPPEFRVPGSNPEKPGKIMIFPGWKTMRKNPEITRNIFLVPGSEMFFRVVPSSGLEIFFRKNGNPMRKYTNYKKQPALQLC